MEEVGHVIQSNELTGCIKVIFHADYKRIIREIPNGSIVKVVLIKKGEED